MIDIKKMDKKFGDLYKALRQEGAESLVVPHPEVLGDNYEELVFNLNVIADSGKALVIVPTNERK